MIKTIKKVIKDVAEKKELEKQKRKEFEIEMRKYCNPPEYIIRSDLNGKNNK